MANQSLNPADRLHDELHLAVLELLDAAEAQDVWSRAEGSENRWVRLAVPALLLDKLSAEAE